MKSRPAPSGFTLIELMVYIALIAGILLGATGVAWSVINSRTKAHVVQEVQQNGRFIIEKITQSAHAANSINTPTRGNSGSTLSLQMQDGALDPIIITTSGNNITRSVAGGTAVQLNSDSVTVSTFSATNQSSANGKTRNVDISLTLEHINPNNQQEWDYSETFSTSIELFDF